MPKPLKPGDKVTLPRSPLVWEIVSITNGEAHLHVPDMLLERFRVPVDQLKPAKK